jgi:hypothetical protein
MDLTVTERETYLNAGAFAWLTTAFDCPDDCVSGSCSGSFSGCFWTTPKVNLGRPMSEIPLRCENCGVRILVGELYYELLSTDECDQAFDNCLNCTTPEPKGWHYVSSPTIHDRFLGAVVEPASLKDAKPYAINL